MSHPSPSSRQPELSRRALVTGAAWSVPLIAAASAAPVAAASGVCTQDAQLSWQNTFTATDTRNGVGTFTTPTGEVVTYTVTVATGPSIEVPATSDNLNTTGDGIFLGDRQTVAAANKEFDAAYTQTTTITFDRPLANIRFRVFDVDGSDFYREHLRVIGLPGAVATPGNRVELEPVSNTYRPTEDLPIGPVVAGSVTYSSTGSTDSFVVELTTPRTAVPPQGVLSHGVRMTNLTYTTACPAV
ncbi:hypothetical protein C5E07_17530 [Pseudoclavibacter sp. RFBJ3]|uniref:hypothetical protein n=1 Tax=unclassified Pseudoclavibacter TaxID=2615177 RepID=UPI000CE89601|nr:MULTISPECIES: hypothetical protein [unclassified Pseudoclavibacter]PPF87169.1 hypothetical protein C5C12_00590 [Pseudoclavibacter sp. RFBJ5]PPF89392.1 hypothetical protein C5E07_17530 [Pseudoclavibacter sp. RFBJ3]PPG00803.1 hypothetical protein C5C19_01210 [Pseudoclavibacter sp. RFBH5]PPG18911.1 hypothetical protein C5E13_18015 [Pseudoclavibacter sp. RFBI4]